MRSRTAPVASFVRSGPHVIPKRSLTGENIERGRTRALQVTFDVNPLGEALYVGQQLEVFVNVAFMPGANGA